MKQLTALLTLSILLFSVPVWAEEITMICHSSGSTRTSMDEETWAFRYENPIVGSKKVLIRREGSWEDWRAEGKQHTPPKLRITDRGAVLETVDLWEVTDSRSTGLSRGTKLLMHNRDILDFEFLTRTVHWYGTLMDGAPSETGRLGADPDYPVIERWSCKKP